MFKGKRSISACLLFVSSFTVRWLCVNAVTNCHCEKITIFSGEYALILRKVNL